MALDLFKTLVAKDHGFDEAIAAASDRMKKYESEGFASLDYEVLVVMKLFKALFDKGRGFDEAKKLLKDSEVPYENRYRLRELLEKYPA